MIHYIKTPPMIFDLTRRVKPVDVWRWEVVQPNGRPLYGGGSSLDEAKAGCLRQVMQALSIGDLPISARVLGKKTLELDLHVLGMDTVCAMEWRTEKSTRHSAAKPRKRQRPIDMFAVMATALGVPRHRAKEIAREIVEANADT